VHKCNITVALKTQKQPIEIRINNEIRFEYIKKQKLNTQLYNLRLIISKYLKKKAWDLILDNIEAKVKIELDKQNLTFKVKILIGNPEEKRTCQRNECK
jgi:hypothetical protein